MTSADELAVQQAADQIVIARVGLAWTDVEENDDDSA